MPARNVRSREERRKLPQWYRAFSAALTVLAVAAVCFCGVLALIARMSDAGDPVLGNIILTVRSGSMAPAIETGDVLLFDAYDGGAEERDIVVFRAPSGAYEGELITHRIVRAKTVDGEKVYFTKGDAAASEDAWTLGDGDIVGVYRKKLPLIADVAGHMRTAGGRMLVIGLPILLLAAVFIADFALSEKLLQRAEERDAKGEREEERQH